MDFNILITKNQILKLFLGKFAFIYVVQCFQNRLNLQLKLI